MHTRIYRLTLAALVGLAVPAAAPEYEASDYLPLAVGNSWTFHHEAFDEDEKWLPGGADPSTWPAYAAHLPKTPSFTITVERTEVIDGKTYYVLSDMPSGGWPPAPPHFLAGKKLRWKGAHLMERTDSGEQESVFRFDGPGAYTIPTTEGDNEVQSSVRPISDTYPVPEFYFHFHGYDGYGEWPAGEGEPWTAGRYCWFLPGYGLGGCTEFIRASDYGVFDNEINPLSATLVKKSRFVGGSSGEDSGSTVTVSYEDARRGRTTATSSSSWGEIKQLR